MDDDLEAIRAQRMAQLRQNPQVGPGQTGANDQGRNAEEQKKQEAEMRNAILAQVLDQSARARLNTIALAKPEKAKMIENMVIQMATRGQIGSRLSEDQFKHILSQVQEQTKTTTTVKFDRRRAQLDDDDEDKY
ncbi:programmed cell death protein 5-like [Paramacrobiotus metropolitanus]|uniref:programmed cell death protein 5-like n=1 Tax=Paramacrobiotus metropolitanus TaxID=2943436 RepID=UPI0024460978|nr:programmed cell death protein 5-like [Paramacrobiotus metropolitanus]